MIDRGPIHLDRAFQINIQRVKSRLEFRGNLGYFRAILMWVIGFQ